MIFSAILLAAGVQEIIPQVQPPAPVAIREPDCRMPRSLRDMEGCRGQDYPEAYFEMELEWVKAVETAQRFDQLLGEEANAPFGMGLSRAQGDWLKYRDNHCVLLIAYGEDTELRATSWSACMARLTKARAQELRAFSQSLESEMN